jgi:ABC-type uncharacterized transport system substrate-binding protein
LSALWGGKGREGAASISTLFDLTINLKTASALELTIPQSVLQRAGQVIQ